MITLPDCYGTMFPDFTRLGPNKPAEGVALSALVASHGIGAQSRELMVKPEGWAKCAECPAYRTCYDLSFAQMFMRTLLANGWYGS